MDMYSINIVVICEYVMSTYGHYVYRKQNLVALTFTKTFVFAVWLYRNITIIIGTRVTFQGSELLAEE